MMWEYWKYERPGRLEFVLQPAGMEVPHGLDTSELMVLVAPAFEAETVDEAKIIADDLSGITKFLEEIEKQERHEYYEKHKKMTQ